MFVLRAGESDGDLIQDFAGPASSAATGWSSAASGGAVS